MDSGSLLQAIASLIFVIALIGLSAVAYRRFVMEKNILQGNAKRRLQLVENLYLDAKRRLVIIKKDDEEIVLLLGATTETVIKTNSPAKKPTESPIGTSGKKIKAKKRKS